MPAQVDEKESFRSGLSFANPKLTAAAKTTTYTIKPEDGSLILADATAAGFTITLPSAARDPDGAFLMVKLTTSTANTVTVAAAGSDTIDGAATSTLLVTSKKCLQLASDGVAKWFIVGIF